MQELFFNIDVVGSCNLKCPSCPVGNFKEVQNPTGFMKPELLEEIMEKALTECKIKGVGLFNWTEPLLHPQLPELVEIVQATKVPCFLSSNLNILKNIDALMKSNPYSFRISVSGFTQEVYGVTHQGGNIERVKKNMVLLSESIARNSSSTKVQVLYHRYLGNIDDEILMKNFATSLGFEFSPVWAFMMPLEKVIAYINDDLTEANLTQQDFKTIERLALPLTSALQVAQTYKNKPCTLRDNEMTIDYQGNVQLCCSVYDSSKYTIAPFLSTSITALQKAKYEQNVCLKCMDKGIHVYYTYAAPEFNELATKNVIEHYSKYLGLSLSLQFNQRQELVEKLRDDLKLRDLNFAIFPDWSKIEGALDLELEQVLRVFLNHPNKNRVTVLIDVSSIADRIADGEFALSSIVMKIMMEEDIEVADGPEICLVDNPGKIRAILPLIHSRIIMEYENEQALKQSGILNISSWELNQVRSTRFFQPAPLLAEPLKQKD